MLVKIIYVVAIIVLLRQFWRKKYSPSQKQKAFAGEFKISGTSQCSVIRYLYHYYYLSTTNNHHHDSLSSLFKSSQIRQWLKCALVSLCNTREFGRGTMSTFSAGCLMFLLLFLLFFVCLFFAVFRLFLLFVFMLFRRTMSPFRFCCFFCSLCCCWGGLCLLSVQAFWLFFCFGDFESNHVMSVFSAIVFCFFFLRLVRLTMFSFSEGSFAALLRSPNHW